MQAPVAGGPTSVRLTGNEFPATELSVKPFGSFRRCICGPTVGQNLSFAKRPSTFTIPDGIKTNGNQMQRI